MPILFEGMRLTPRLVNRPVRSDPVRERIIGILHTCAKKVFITQELSWYKAMKLLSSCKSLKDLL